MSRIPTPIIEDAPAEAQPHLAAIKRQVGTVPNLFRIVAKLDDAEITANRSGASNDLRADAAVRFAAKLARERGQVSETDIAAIKVAGYSDAEIVEVIAHVALNVFTNYVNEALKTEIDFPHVGAREAA